MSFLAENVVLVFALVFVGVAGLAAWFITHQISASGASMFGTRERRLGLVQSVVIGGGRRLILIRRDDVEHLIMTGGPVDAVIETGIRRGRPVANGHMGEYPSHEAARTPDLNEEDADGRRVEPAIVLAASSASSHGDAEASSRFGMPPRPQTAGSPIATMGSLFRKLRGASAGEDDSHADSSSPHAAPKHLTTPILAGEGRDAGQDAPETMELGETKAEKVQ
jgi:flagellar protein FliO/FliZ